MITNAKEARYNRVYTQIKELVTPVTNPYSRMATIAALLHHKMGSFFWTGFYLIDDGNLVVGPYQGPLACLKLKKDTGVCWSAINAQKTVIVANVEDFPGHIACSSLSKSEIVIPLFNHGSVVGCLDVDSKTLNSFDDVDKEGLEKIVSLVYF
jgi:L-methionine (R)-S-oxide reductase